MAVYKVEAHQVDPTQPNVLGAALGGQPKVSTKYLIRYIVKVYEDNGTTRRGGTVHWSLSGSSSPANISWSKDFKQSGGVFVNANTNYTSDVKATGVCTLKPVFTVTFNDGYGEETATLALDEPAIPTPIFTIAKSVNATIPKPIIQDLTAGNAQSTTNDIVWDDCNKMWVAMIRYYDSSILTLHPYSYAIKFYDAVGVKKKSDIKIAKKDVAKADTSKGSGYKTAYQYILDVKTKVKCSDNVVPKDPTSDLYSGSGVQTIPSQERFNPANHVMTRSESFSERIAEDINSGISTFTTNLMAAAPLLNFDNIRGNRLGYIYQDPTTAQALNLGAKGTKKTTAITPENLWGFRFNYNPTTISYGTQSSSSLDFTTFSKDPANLVGGNTVISFDLYLNRIADMTTCNPKSEEYANATNYYAMSSRGGLTDNQKTGIWNRGTEFDLEYLYRVINGDPQKSNMLSSGGVSADFGYVTGAPFWLRLHDNMKYFCAISSLSVNHVMFDSRMVPTLSIVTLTLIRYPGSTNDVNTNKAANKTLTIPKTPKQ